MELDYTRQSSMESFTKSRYILAVFEWIGEKNLNTIGLVAVDRNEFSICWAGAQ